MMYCIYSIVACWRFCFKALAVTLTSKLIDHLSMFPIASHCFLGFLGRSLDGVSPSGCYSLCLRRRLLLFTPDFGSVNSFHSSWSKLDADLWVVSWQGWTSWDEMIEQVTRKVLSLADGVSTVWYGHSMGAIVAYEVLKQFETRYRSPGPQDDGF